MALGVWCVLSDEECKACIASSWLNNLQPFSKTDAWVGLRSAKSRTYTAARWHHAKPLCIPWKNNREWTKALDKVLASSQCPIACRLRIRHPGEFAPNPEKLSECQAALANSYCEDWNLHHWENISSAFGCLCHEASNSCQTQLHRTVFTQPLMEFWMRSNLRW